MPRLQLPAAPQMQLRVLEVVGSWVLLSSSWALLFVRRAGLLRRRSCSDQQPGALQKWGASCPAAAAAPTNPPPLLPPLADLIAPYHSHPLCPRLPHRPPLSSRQLAVHRFRERWPRPRPSCGHPCQLLPRSGMRSPHLELVAVVAAVASARKPLPAPLARPLPHSLLEPNSLAKRSVAGGMRAWGAAVAWGEWLDSESPTRD